MKAPGSYSGASLWRASYWAFVWGQVVEAFWLGEVSRAGVLGALYAILFALVEAGRWLKGHLRWV